jgi:hypothetical protein
MADKPTSRIYPVIRETFPEPLDPQPSPQTTLRGHLALIARVERAGLAPPEPWRALHEGYGVLQQTVTGDGSEAFGQLLDAIEHGPHSEIAARLRVASAPIDPNVVEAAHAHIHGRLKDAYTPVARRHYAALASRFDRTAEAFTKVTRRVDVEAGADAILADRKALTAWEEAPALARELSQLLGPLAAAALLVRGDEQPCRLGSDPATFEISLCCDLGGIHPRRVWLAWRQEIETRPVTDGLMLSDLATPPIQHVERRCGRWSGVLAAGGASIAAHPDPVSLELFSPPRRRQIITADPSGRRISPAIVDPEDDAQVPSRWRRLVGALSGRHQEPPVDLLDTVSFGTTEED